PYLLFIGDARDQLAAKTAYGVAHWRPELCVGQLRLKGCEISVGLPDMTVAEAAAAGTRTLVIGVANRGGVISGAWADTMTRALDAGMDIASGLHNRLSEVPGLAETAAGLGRDLIEVRVPSRAYPIGTGARRAGKRLITVGTDVSVGKMYAALAIEREMRDRGFNADFRATGQTGIFIAGDGVAVDAVVSDFISGATEWLCPANDDDHWDVIEGQGSVLHPSYAGVTLGLLHGAQADILVACHDASRTRMRGAPEYPVPSIADCIAAHLAGARLTNADARCIGVAINTSGLDPKTAERTLKETEDRLGLPCVDPVATGVSAIVDRLA
ncbi:MAG: DUF1611 domain-containing protein, partial [Rhodospirillales bacterium]|nr:DUF1611 domain-containing protein [Rhodospirillales bacterium]